MEIFSLNSTRRSPEEDDDGLDLNVDPGFIVTKITPGVKNQQRVNVFLNQKFSFSLSIEQLVDLKLKVGQKISDSELEYYRELSNFGKIYQRTLEWLLIRPRSIQETKEYLKRKQLQSERMGEGSLALMISDRMITEIIEKLIEKRLLDDYKFAEFYIANRMVKKGVSQLRLEQELRKKGVDPEVIKLTIINSERSDEAEIDKMIAKKGGKYSHEKLIAYLVRQGFDYQLAKSRVREKDSQNSE